MDSSNTPPPTRLTNENLRQWLIENNEQDQWWLCLDGVTEESPVELVEVERHLASGNYATAQVLHISQCEAESPPWIHVALIEKAKIPFNPIPRKQASADNLQSVQPRGNDAARSCLFVFVAVAFSGFLIFKMETCGDRATGTSSAADQSESTQMSSAIDSSGEAEITGDYFTGFVSEADWKRAGELAPDAEAHSKFVLVGILNHTATLFKKGESVYVEDSSLLGERIRVRRKGETVSYWTQREAIMK